MASLEMLLVLDAGVSPDFLSILSPLFLLVIYSSGSCPLDSCEAFRNSGCQETVYCLLTELSG